MNESTHDVLRTEIFTVFEFSLGPVPLGSSRQKVRSLGDFHSVEEAFDTAKEKAESMRDLLAAKSPAVTSPSAGNIESPPWILSTEFGYDVKRGHLTLARFWVHSRPA